MTQAKIKYLEAGRIVKIRDDSEHLYKVASGTNNFIFQEDFVWVDEIGSKKRRIVEGADIDINVTDRDKLRLL
jgi:hypothetical protein